MKNADVYGIIAYYPGHSFSLYGGSVESMYYLLVSVFPLMFFIPDSSLRLTPSFGDALELWECKGFIEYNVCIYIFRVCSMKSYN